MERHQIHYFLAVCAQGGGGGCGGRLAAAWRRRAVPSEPALPRTLCRSVQIRPLIDPEVARDVVLLTVAGRRFAAAVAKFVEAIRRYRRPDSAEPERTLVA